MSAKNLIKNLLEGGKCRKCGKPSSEHDGLCPECDDKEHEDRGAEIDARNDREDGQD